MVSCPRLSNQCKFGLANQQARRYAPATELELIRFWRSPFKDLVWHLSTQLNYSNLDAYITVFDPRRGKFRHFIPFLVYDLFYPSIGSNIVNLAFLTSWSDSVSMHICSHFLRKYLLR